MLLSYCGTKNTPVPHQNAGTGAENTSCGATRLGAIAPTFLRTIIRWPCSRSAHSGSPTCFGSPSDAHSIRTAVPPFHQPATLCNIGYESTYTSSTVSTIKTHLSAVVKHLAKIISPLFIDARGGLVYNYHEKIWASPTPIYTGGTTYEICLR